MHRYANGKRGYKSFTCVRCPAVVRVDKMKIKRVWKCHDCATPPSYVVRDSKGNKQVRKPD